MNSFPGMTTSLARLTPKSSQPVQCFFVQVMMVSSPFSEAKTPELLADTATAPSHTWRCHVVHRYHSSCLKGENSHPKNTHFLGE